ncbi:MAG: hypothetical protein GXP29_00215 [Planctomycetes bacterium]|nr:hypothetical protein [Planctomycetota bacterium]
MYHFPPTHFRLFDYNASSFLLTLAAVCIAFISPVGKTMADDSDGSRTLATSGGLSSVLFVDAGAAGGANDGSSWPDAYVKLQDALLDASSNSIVDQIWVAAGTYRPDQGDGQTPGDRSETFQLQSNLAIYGGFSGTETSLDQRDSETNLTILSGDLLGDDTPNFGSNGENSFHIVTGLGADNSAVLDGFTIRGGNADGVSPDNRGAGMSNDFGSPTVTRCNFTGNSASIGGGVANFNSSPALIACVFLANSASEGGGIANLAGSSPPMTNCIFSGNTAASGGGVFNDSGSSPIVANCTISANAASSSGGGLFSSNNSFPSVIGSIVWGNTPDQSNVNSSLFETSIIQDGLPLHGVIDADPLFVDFDGADGVVGNEDDDLRVLPGSPAIDAGDNGAIPVGVITDLDGHPRFVDDPSTPDTGAGASPLIDMGAYEFRLGDCDADGDTDLIDHSQLDACLTDPNAPLGAGCACIDLDADGDVDLRDFALFQWGFGL